MLATCFQFETARPLEGGLHINRVANDSYYERIVVSFFFILDFGIGCRANGMSRDFEIFFWAPLQHSFFRRADLGVTDFVIPPSRSSDDAIDVDGGMIKIGDETRPSAISLPCRNSFSLIQFYDDVMESASALELGSPGIDGTEDPINKKIKFVLSSNRAEKFYLSRPPRKWITTHVTAMLLGFFFHEVTSPPFHRIRVQRRSTTFSPPVF
jgi:hypothetical protein